MAVRDGPVRGEGDVAGGNVLCGGMLCRRVVMLLVGGCITGLLGIRGLWGLMCYVLVCGTWCASTWGFGIGGQAPCLTANVG